MSNYTVCDNCGIEIHGLGMTVTETDCPECGETTSVTPVGGPREILRSQVTSSPAVNGGASLHSGEPGRPVRFQDWLSRRRWGGFRPSAGSVLWRCHGRSHPKACHRGRFSTDRSHPIGRTSRFCVGTVHTLSAKGHQPGFPRAANMGGVRPTSRARSQWDVA